MSERVSKLDEVQLPVVEYALQTLKTGSGGPVVVLCERIPTMELMSITGMTPGAAPQLARLEDMPPEEEVQRISHYARPVVVAGTALRGENGALVRPAFSEDGRPGTIPLRYIGEPDLLGMFKEIMRLSNWWTEASQAAAFRDENGAGSPGGAGDMAAGQGGGEAAERAAAGTD
jgi:hypothetical protein